MDAKIYRLKDSVNFIQNFIGRAGTYVFSSVVIARVLSFIASWIALQLIPHDDLGVVIYAFQIITFLIPIGGLGLHQSLIRYGSQLGSIKEKNDLFQFAVKRGIIASFFLIIIVSLFALFKDFEREETSFYLVLLSFALITHYVFELVKIQCRLQKRNKLYAYADVSYNFLLVVLIFIGSYYFSALGYAIAILMVPFIASLIFIPTLKVEWKKILNLPMVNFKFFRYGFFASLSNVTTQLLISIDIILIGNILEDASLITAFRYISIVPYSLLFLSNAVVITDFVDITEKINDKKYVNKYIKSYMRIFGIISLICLISLFFLGEYILAIFDVGYKQYHTTFMVLTIGICGILTFRSIFGNLLSSIGKAHINLLITGVAVCLNLILNYRLIPEFELFGAAITSATLMWFSGILSMIFFVYYYRRNSNFIG